MIRGIIVNVATSNGDAPLVDSIEQALFRVFEGAMTEIFSVDPVYLIGELRNSWTDILTDYVADNLNTLLGPHKFGFSGRGGFHLVWNSPPEVHLELTYETEAYRVVFWLHTDGTKQSCHLKEFIVQGEGSFQDAAQDFLRHLEACEAAAPSQVLHPPANIG